MKLKQVIETLNGTPQFIANKQIEEKEFTYAFASDLMSDALAMISDSGTTIMLTGLVNAQSLRTAEMLDIEVLIYVRGKKLGETDLALAEEQKFNIYSTNLTMYEACGMLYSLGLKPVS